MLLPIVPADLKLVPADVEKLFKKISWKGEIISIQPRIRLLRSFDELSHSYLGYILRIQGTIGEVKREFLVAVGNGTHTKHKFQIGDFIVSGFGFSAGGSLEIADLYRVSGLKVERKESGTSPKPPPWHGIPPELNIYRERGHRRLAARTYKEKCWSCIWGCCMPVEMIIDQWNPSQCRYRTETFCYGPLTCPFHKAGPTRKVPGRNGMSWEEPDWVDEDATSHRAPDE